MEQASDARLSLAFIIPTHPAHKLFARLKIESFESRPAENGKPPRAFADYAPRITFDGTPLDEFIKPGAEKNLGDGVILIRRICPLLSCTSHPASPPQLNSVGC